MYASETVSRFSDTTPDFGRLSQSTFSIKNVKLSDDNLLTNPVFSWLYFDDRYCTCNGVVIPSGYHIWSNKIEQK